MWRPLAFLPLVLISLIACASPPPVVPGPSLVIAPAPPAPGPTLTVADASPAPPPPPPPPTLRVSEGGLEVGELAGAWQWEEDVQLFRPDGTGTYYRAGAVCYELTYQIEGHVVSTMADRHHTCGAKRSNAWEIHVVAGELHMKHVGSGFETSWKRAP